MTREGIAIFGIVAVISAVTIYILGGRTADAQAMGGAILLISALLTFIAILGQLSGEASAAVRSGDVTQVVNIHTTQPQQQAQAQPVYYQQPQQMTSQQPQIVYLPSPAPQPAQQVGVSREEVTALVGQQMRAMLTELKEHLQPQINQAPAPMHLTASNDGRYLPMAPSQRALAAPEPTTFAKRFLERLTS